MSRGWVTEYRNTVEVEDDDGEVHVLKVFFRAYEEHDTWTDPGDYEEFDHEYEFDGRTCKESELPDYVTASIIERAKSTAAASGDSRDSGPD